MVFYKYGIHLERLEQRNLELVRQWRNNDFVRSRMIVKETISADAQVTWFAQLHQRNNWYFIASSNKSPIGVFHIKNINWEQRSGEAGAFVCHSKFIGQVVTGLAILALMDFGFFALGLDYLKAKYHPAFSAIVLLNNQLGYEVCMHHANGFVEARATIEQYLKSTVLLRKAAEKIQGNTTYFEGEDAWLDKKIKKVKLGRQASFM